MADTVYSIDNYNDGDTGWSKLLKIRDEDLDKICDNTIGSSVLQSSSYNSSYDLFTLSGSWFQKSWWTGENKWRWARRYKNITELPQRLTKISFLACPGHSNGKTYGGTPTGGYLGPSDGHGCTFEARIYVPGQAKPINPSASVTLKNISKYNCYYGGYGNTTNSNDKTSFGHLAYYGVGTGYATVNGSPNAESGYDESTDTGAKRYRHKQEFIFEDAPLLEPGQCMYVVIEPTSWSAGSTDSNSLLVIQSDDENFESEFEQEPSPYIWRYNGTKWEKVLKAKMYMGNGIGWIQME